MAWVGVAAMLACACAGPVVSRYGDKTFPRDAHRNTGVWWRPDPHSGVDFDAEVGAPVIAAAPGVVSAIKRLEGQTWVAIFHPAFDVYTIYGHLSRASVRVGDYTERGSVIGFVAWHSAYSHVHLTLSRCKMCFSEGSTSDPLAVSKGCFRAGARYSEERLELTYPVRC